MSTSIHLVYLNNLTVQHLLYVHKIFHFIDHKILRFKISMHILINIYS